MQGDINSFVLSQGPPAEDTPMGWELAIQFVSIAKRDFGIREAWEIGQAIRAWNARWGSPFPNEKIEELIRVPPAPKKEKRPRPNPSEPMFPEFIIKGKGGRKL